MFSPTTCRVCKYAVFLPFQSPNDLQELAVAIKNDAVAAQR